MVEKRGRRTCGVVAASLMALALMLGGSQTAAAQSGTKVTVRQGFPSKSANFWPNYVANELGFYAKEGVDYQPQIVDPNILVATLLGNSMEITYADATQVVLAVEKGAKVYSVGLSNDRQPYRIMTSPTIKTVQDLKGKRVAISSAIDVYTYVLKNFLRKGGLDPENDVEWVVGGSQNQRLAAIQSGAINAGLFSFPGSTRLTSLGYNTLAFTPDLIHELTLSVETVTADFAQKNNGEDLRKVLRAENEAVKWLNTPSNKAKAIEILAKSTGAKPEDSEEAYEYFIGHKYWERACVRPEGLTNVVKIMRETKQLTKLSEADIPKFVKTDWCAK